MTFILVTLLGVVLAVFGNESLHLAMCLEFLVQWGFIFLPIVVVLRVCRYDLRESLNLNIPEWAPLIGTLLIAPSSCIILFEMQSWQTRVLPMPAELNALVDVIRGIGQSNTGFVILIAAGAFSPAICEELLYRGVLFSSLRRKLKPVPLTIVIALLFSLYHLHPWRMILILPLGVLLTYVVLRSGTVYLSMLLHFIVNTLSLVLITRRHEEWFPAISYSEEQGFAMTVVVAMSAVFIGGVVLLERHALSRTGRHTP